MTEEYKNLDVLLRLFQSGRLYGGWLLIGPKGVGKARTAYKFASEVYKKPVESLKTGGHGAFKVLECDLTDEEKKKRQALIDAGKELDLKEEAVRARKSSIGIDDVRKMIGFTGFKAFETEPKIILVDSMDDMQEEAASAFLKTLEEPPSHTAFLLVCHNEHRLLDTVKSRCRRIYFKRLSDGEMNDVIKDPEIASMASGCPGRAFKMEAQKAGIQGLVDGINLKDQKKVASEIDRLLKTEEGDFTVKTIVLNEIYRRSKEGSKESRKKISILFAETEQRFRQMDGLYLDKKNIFINQIEKIWN